MPLPAWRYLWAKTSSQGEPSYHPLICHLIDVAMVTRSLWQKTLSPALRARLAAALGTDETTAGNWLALIAGLHDLGKASPAFQSQWEEGRQRLTSLGLSFPKQDKFVPHGTVTAVLLLKVLPTLGWPPDLAKRIAITVGGHHGLFPTRGDRQQAGPLAQGGPDWESQRQPLISALLNACGLAGVPAPRAELPGDHAFFLILAGLTAVSDWIGSDAGHFPFTPPDTDLSSYRQQACHSAESALESMAWSQWQPDLHPLSFPELFGFEPRTLQQAAVELGNQTPAPALFLVESPMGEGKTEAAMYLADQATVRHGQVGAYFALPTMATSNQMFTRVARFLRHRYRESMVNLHLLHGHAALSAEFELLRAGASHMLQPSQIDRQPGQDGTVVAAEWFTHRKRGLLAPFGVGTVDQALLAVLQTKHFFVRLFGLAHKTVIIDEVHAYDAYMSELLERLLTWLAALGSTVVLLSATLPRARRRRLLDAWAAGLGCEPVDLPEKPYPRLTWVARDQSDARHVPATARRSIDVAWKDGRMPADPAQTFPLGEELAGALDGGGCAVVICNTVRQAQQVYQALKAYFAPDELDLFHARYPFAERARREERTLTRFGKDGDRPRRAVLIATQVVEQSLDIDFDLMVSYLAPVDLILQRAGRLHRHERKRPPGLEQPALWLCRPDTDSNGLPHFDPGTIEIYAPHILLRTWLALRDLKRLTIPDMVEGLIEAVYDDDAACPAQLPVAVHQAWKSTRSQLEQKREAHRTVARARLVEQPTYPDEILERFNAQMEEEDPSVHVSLQALTRLSGPTVSLVCLTEPLADPTAVPSLAEARRLLERSVSISAPGLVHHLIAEGEIPAGWRKSALLRHHRAVLFNADGLAQAGEWTLRLDAELGLLATRIGKEVT